MMKKNLSCCRTSFGRSNDNQRKNCCRPYGPTDVVDRDGNQQLQIMVTGEGIRDAVPSVDCPGVKLDSVARLDSPNYQFLYLTIGSDAKPGTVDITLPVASAKSRSNMNCLPVRATEQVTRVSTLPTCFT